MRASLLTDSPLVRATAELDRARTLFALGRQAPALVSARAAREHFVSKGHLPGARRAGCVPDEAMVTTTERS